MIFILSTSGLLSSVCNFERAAAFKRLFSSRSTLSRSILSKIGRRLLYASSLKLSGRSVMFLNLNILFCLNFCLGNSDTEPYKSIKSNKNCPIILFTNPALIDALTELISASFFCSGVNFLFPIACSTVSLIS